jgi:hypothetical protein
VYGAARRARRVHAAHPAPYTRSCHTYDARLAGVRNLFDRLRVCMIFKWIRREYRDGQLEGEGTTGGG